MMHLCWDGIDPMTKISSLKFLRKNYTLRAFVQNSGPLQVNSQWPSSKEHKCLFLLLSRWLLTREALNSVRTQGMHEWHCSAVVDAYWIDKEWRCQMVRLS